MKNIFIFTILSVALACPAIADENRCDPWAGYMAKMLVPGFMSGMMGYPGMGGVYGGGMPGGMGSGTSAKPTGGGVGMGGVGLGVGMGMGIGIGLGSYVPPLTDDVKSTLKGDKKAIQSKYEQYVLTQNEMMAEWGRIAEQQMEAMKNGQMPGPYTQNPKIEELSKKMTAQADAYKKEMFAYGNKNNCMQGFEAAVQKRQFDEMSATFTMNNKFLWEKDKTIQELRKSNKRAMAALEECKTAAPSIASKMQKSIDAITEQLDKQNSCPMCGFGVEAGAAF